MNHPPCPQAPHGIIHPHAIRPPGLTRRSALRSALGFTAAGAALASPHPEAQATPPSPDPRRSSPKRYQMKKSINLWAFPYPDHMSLRECLQLAKDAGFDAVELNYDLESELSPLSGPAEFQAIRKMAEEIGIAISGLCSFLFWPYPLTSEDPALRQRGIELAAKMTEAAHHLGTENLLVVPGAVHIPWDETHQPVRPDVCDARAREAIASLLPLAEKLGVYLNMENIFFNAFLMSPAEMIEFVDSFQSDHVQVHFDTGNIMLVQFPEHWIPLLGKRIKNTHLKEFNKGGTDHTLTSFRPLLDGTTNWPAVMDALEEVGYEGYLTFEYFHPYPHYPEALIYQTADSLDRIIGIKA
jgi:L-ribulose-5-phosphate 3-epimerase